MTLLPRAWFCLDLHALSLPGSCDIRTLELDSLSTLNLSACFHTDHFATILILCLMLPPLAVQCVTINNTSQYLDWEMTFWNVGIVLESYLHSVFFSTFGDIYYIKWTQNNIITFLRYFWIINLNQLSLKPTKHDIFPLISSMSYEGRRNTKYNEQSICSRNGLTDKCQRV